MFRQTNKKGRVFISYRREDTQWFAGRLADSLSSYFGDKRVFRDVDGIEGGADFSQVIHSTLQASDAAIVLIGEQWLSTTDESGNRRLDNGDDWVCQEVATAIEAGIPIYPVLVEDTPMPRSAELPDRLQPLLRFNATSISDRRWDSEVQRLAKIIGLDVPSETERKLNVLNLVISLSLITSLLFCCAMLFKSLACHIAITHPLSELLSFLACISETSENSSIATTLWPLSLSVSGIPFVAIAFSSAMLIAFARFIDSTCRPWFVAAGWTGALGTLLAFVALDPIPIPYEPVSMFFIAITTILLMFLFMCLSGFRPK